MGLLSHDNILKLHAAVLSASLVESRMALLAGIDPRFIAGLPRATSPSDQILRDLNALNMTEILDDGAVPLAVWIMNAVALAEPRLEAAVFRGALAQCQAPGRPRSTLSSRIDARAPLVAEEPIQILDPCVKKKVLWVDDDRFSLSSMSFWLTDRGYEVMTAKTPGEALKALRKDHGQLGCAILDLYLPGPSSPMEPSGLRLARAIKKEWPQIPLVCLSNIVSTEAVEWFRTYGAGYFHKHQLDSAMRLFLRTIDQALTGKRVPPSALIVHGHAEALLIELKAYLHSELMWTNVRVLRDIPTIGRSVVQKFSDEARDVELVFVLLSPEDATFASAEPRGGIGADTNVVFELGYILGSSKRRSSKVVILTMGEATLPLDTSGAAVIDAAGGVRASRGRLLRELAEWVE